MEFHILGSLVQIDATRLAYNKYRVQFVPLAEEAAARFQTVYQENTSLEQLVRRLPEQVDRCLQPVIQHCISMLVERQILVVDEKHFRTEYQEVLSVWSEPYLKLCDQYAEIVMGEEELDHYREARRKGRGRVVGGGFGLSGAVKGMATAGAMNMAIGAGHMIFNGLGKIASSMAASAKMGRIFRDIATYNDLADGVWQSAFYCHLALLDSLQRAGVESNALDGFVKSEEERAAAAILQNAKQMTDDRQRRDALIHSFQCDPYNDEWYIYVLECFGDAGGELESLAETFGVRVIRQEKERQIRAMANTLSLDTEALALEAQEKILAYQERLNYGGELAEVVKIQSAVKAFDEAYRTVDGILLGSREEADRARSELDEIMSLVRQTDFENTASIGAARKAISAYSTPLAVKYQEDLRQREFHLEQKQKTVVPQFPGAEPILCGSIREAEQVRAQAEQLQRRLEGCDTAENREGELLALQSRVQAEYGSQPLGQRYLEEIVRRLAEIDLSCRTILGTVYPTRAQALKAQADYDELKAQLAGGNVRRHAEQIRAAIQKADFSETLRGALESELFEKANEKEIRVAHTLGNISAVLLLVIIVGSYFFQISATEQLRQRQVEVLGVPLLITEHQSVSSLTFLDGLKNGIVVFGRAVGDMFVEGFQEYIGGFDYGWIGNIVWAVVGFFWVAIKEMIVVIPRYFVTLALTFFQQGSIGYYVGYLISAAVPVAVSQLSFDDEKQEENVRRIKGWTPKKIAAMVLMILGIAGICWYFLQNGG